MECVGQFLFGSGIGDVSALSNVETYRRILAGLVEVQREFTVLPLTQLSAGEMRKFCGEEPSLLTELLEGMDDGETVTLPSMNILNHTHFVNYGGWFDFLSCCEIVSFFLHSRTQVATTRTYSPRCTQHRFGRSSSLPIRYRGESVDIFCQQDSLLVCQGCWRSVVEENAHFWVGKGSQ